MSRTRPQVLGNHWFSSHRVLRFLQLWLRIRATVSASGASKPGAAKPMACCRGCAHNFYETSKTKRARASLRAAYHHASECHRKLWPGIQVPPIQTITGSDQDGTDACICTSLLVAYITHMLTQSKRSAQFRHRSYELLKSLIEQLAVHGPKLDFMMSDIQGRSYWMTQTLATPHAYMPWTKEFFQRHLQMTWMTDLANKDIPWVTSYPTQGQIHLADWLAFSLDIPAWVANKKANKEILWAKQIVERSALAVVTPVSSTHWREHPQRDGGTEPCEKTETLEDSKGCQMELCGKCYGHDLFRAWF